MRDRKSKILLAMIFCLIFGGGALALPKPAEAAITYTPSTNLITVTQGTEAVPNTFAAIYNADKAGTLQLLAPVASALDLDLTQQIRPTDEKVLKLDIIITNYSASGNVVLTGLDKDGVAQTETISISANGTYVTTKWFKSIDVDGIDCTGTYTIGINQGQWGVVSKQETSKYLIESHFQVGNGSTATYLKAIYPEVIQVGTASAKRYIYHKANATTQFGEKDSQGFGIKGATLIMYSPYVSGEYNSWYGTVKFYASSWIRSISGLGYGDPAFRGVYDFVDSTFASMESGKPWYFAPTSSGNLIRDLWDIDGTYLYVYSTGLVFDSIKLPAYCSGILSGVSSTITGVDFGTTKKIAVYHGSTATLIDSPILDDNIIFNTGYSYKKFHINLKVIDKDGNPISGANVKIWDKDETLVTDVNTGADGKIPEQLLTALYKYKATTSSPVISEPKTPHKIRISYQNYPSKESTFTLDKKIDWTIALKDRPMNVGSIKVWGTEYADDEAGTIYAQVLYGDGTPCNTLASSTITATVYKSDGTVIISAAQMTYVTGSNGIYKYDFTGGTFSAEGVYIIDVKVNSASPNIIAYDSNEIHISKTANRTKTMVADIWNTATSTMTTAGSIGKLLVDNIDAKISGIAGAVWSYSGRSLDTITNIVSGVWGESQLGYTTSGTFGYYLNSQISAVASGVWNYTGSIGSTLIQNLGDVVWNSYSGVRKLTSRQIGASDYISGETTSEKPTEYNIELVRKATFDFAGIADSGSTTTLVDAELDQPNDHWNNYELWVMSGQNMGEKRVIEDFVNSTHTLTVTSAFTYAIAAGDQYVISHERKLVHAIWNWSSRQLTSAANIAGEIWGYSGGRTLTSIGSLAADIWDNTYAPTRRLTDETLTGGGKIATQADIDNATSTIIAEVNALDVLETKLDTVDNLVDLIRASQQLNYTVELSDAGEVLQSNTYRAKLSIWDYENNPANAFTTPTVIIYDALRTATSGSMTPLSTGVYEFTYSVPSAATSGFWETVVSVDLGGASALTLNDYWEVEGSPAQVIINSMSDTTVPSISANVTISNEGNAGYEYQYEWCVVSSQDNQCGGGDDIDYASAAKYLAVGADYTANLSATVPNTGNYWFKVVVYYGTEASGASRTFTATTEEATPTPGGGGGGGGGALPSSLDNIYSLLQDLHNEVGYHNTGRTVYQDLSNTRYSLGALPNQLSKPLYEVLIGLSADIQNSGGDTAHSLNDIYGIIEANADDLSYIINKTAELRAMLEVNGGLINCAFNKPIIQTWFTEGSIVLNIMVINPPDTARTVEVKEYLPKEIREEHIIEIEDGLELGYDSALDTYFVSGKAELKAGERKVFKVRAKDVFKISEEEISALKTQAETLMEPLKGTGYFAHASILKSEIDANLDSISRTQVEGPSNIEKKISVYQKNQNDLQKAKGNIEALKVIVSEASGQGGIFGSLFGVSTTMTWAIIIIIIVGIAVLMILLYTHLRRSQTLEHHIADGGRLKAPFLPPFGKPEVDLRRLIKMVVIIGILIALVLLGIYFAPSIFSRKNTTIGNANPVLEEIKLVVVEAVADQLKVSKLKIIETGTSWLNVRSKPSSDGTILTTVNVDEEFEYTDEQDGWYRIILEDKSEGWVSGVYIELLTDK